MSWTEFTVARSNRNKQFQPAAFAWTPSKAVVTNLSNKSIGEVVNRVNYHPKNDQIKPLKPATKVIQYILNASNADRGCVVSSSRRERITNKGGLLVKRENNGSILNGEQQIDNKEDVEQGRRDQSSNVQLSVSQSQLSVSQNDFSMNSVMHIQRNKYTMNSMESEDLIEVEGECDFKLDAELNLKDEHQWSIASPSNVATTVQNVKALPLGNGLRDISFSSSSDAKTSCGSQQTETSLTPLMTAREENKNQLMTVSRNKQQQNKNKVEKGMQFFTPRSVAKERRSLGERDSAVLGRVEDNYHLNRIKRASEIYKSLNFTDKRIVENEVMMMKQQSTLELVGGMIVESPIEAIVNPAGKLGVTTSGGTKKVIKRINNLSKVQNSRQVAEMIYPVQVDQQQKSQLRQSVSALVGVETWRNNYESRFKPSIMYPKQRQSCRSAKDLFQNLD